MGQVSPQYRRIQDWLHSTHRADFSSTTRVADVGDIAQLQGTSYCALPHVDGFDPDHWQGEGRAVIKAAQERRHVIDNGTKSRVRPVSDCAIPIRPSDIDDDPLANGLRMVDTAIMYIETLTSYRHGCVRMDDAVKSVALMHKVALWLETIGDMARNEQASISQRSTTESAGMTRIDRWTYCDRCRDIEFAASHGTSEVLPRSSNLASIVLEKISVLNRLVRRIEESNWLL